MTAPDPQARTRRTVFQERQGYRRRRQIDAARLLAVLGVGLFAVPLLWPRSGDPDVAALPMSSAITYLFSAWALLILASLAVGVAARHWGQAGDGTVPAGQDQGEG